MRGFEFSHIDVYVKENYAPNHWRKLHEATNVLVGLLLIYASARKRTEFSAVIDIERYLSVRYRDRTYKHLRHQGR